MDLADVEVGDDRGESEGLEGDGGREGQSIGGRREKASGGGAGGCGGGGGGVERSHCF